MPVSQPEARLGSEELERVQLVLEVPLALELFEELLLHAT